MSRIKIIALFTLTALFAFFLAWNFKLRAEAEKITTVAHSPATKTGVPLADAEENDRSESPAQFFVENLPASDDYLLAPVPQSFPAVVEARGSYRDLFQFGGAVTDPLRFQMDKP